jgi:hypothetical protein
MRATRIASSKSTRFFSRLMAGCCKSFFRHCIKVHTMKMVLTVSLSLHGTKNIIPLNSSSKVVTFIWISLSGC